MKIIKSYATKNACYKAGNTIKVKGLMLHSVGCAQPDAELWATRLYNQYMPAGAEVCVHGFLQADGKVYQTLPWNYRGWHAGGSANSTHIGVEMCEPDCIKYTGGATFTCSNKSAAKAFVKGCYETAVKLFAYLCETYNLNPTKDGVIISHSEGYTRGVASGHADPEHLWKQLGMGYSMDGFRKAVKASMTGEPEEKETAPVEKKNVIYRVQVGAFSKKSNALALQLKIKAAGFETYLVKVDNLYKVQTGAFTKKANAEAQLAKLEKAGFDGFVSTKGGTATKAASTKKTTTTIKEGNTVKLKKGAKTYDGGVLASFVYKRNHKVLEISGDRVVITYGGQVVAAVNKSDLTLVK